MKPKILTAKPSMWLFLMSPLLLILPGCIATRSWVNEQLDPVGTRVSNLEQRVSSTESVVATGDAHYVGLITDQVNPVRNRVTAMEHQVSAMDDRLTSAERDIQQVGAKADVALVNYNDLRLERRLVLEFDQGAYFPYDSANLLEPAKRNIDRFLSNLGNQAADHHVFFVAGYTDSTGTSDYNYSLGRKRADSVARYLIVDKSIDPKRVFTVSGGASDPAASNITEQGREKNRRVEIFVYRDVLTKGSAGFAGRPSPMAMNP